MSTKKLTIDRFYVLLGASAIFLTLIIIFTLKGILTAFNVTQEIDKELVGSDQVRINKNKLDEAIKIVSNKKVVPLDLSK